MAFITRYLQTLSDQTTMPESLTPQGLRELLNEPLPRQPQGVDVARQDFMAKVADNSAVKASTRAPTSGLGRALARSINRRRMRLFCMTRIIRAFPTQNINPIMLYSMRYSFYFNLLQPNAKINLGD